MVDGDLVLKKLSFVESRVREFRTMARPGLIEADIREERFVVHTLQLAIQAALDSASYIVSDQRLGEPETNRQLFDLLAKDGWLSAELTDSLRDMTGFRNLVVHGYETVDPRIVRDIIDNHLGDLLAFTKAIRDKLRWPTMAAPLRGRCAIVRCLRSRSSGASSAAVRAAHLAPAARTPRSRRTVVSRPCR